MKITNMPCQRCYELEVDHVGGKCLFDTQLYRPFTSEAVLRSLTKQDGPQALEGVAWIHFYEYLRELLNGAAHWGMELRISEDLDQIGTLRMLEVARTVSVQAMGR